MRTKGAIQAKVLYAEGCANTPPTVERIREVAAQLNVPIDLVQVLVQTLEEAEARRFLGSPTVQVNGLDIDPAVRGVREFGFT